MGVDRGGVGCREGGIGGGLDSYAVVEWDAVVEAEAVELVLDVVLGSGITCATWGPPAATITISTC